MKDFNRELVIENYYKAQHALMKIGVAENVPQEIKDLAVDASRKVIKIIDYVNHNKGVKEEL